MKNQIKTQTAATGLKIRTGIKSGKLASNHNQTAETGLKVRTNVRAGHLASNHNQALIRG